MTPAIPVDPHNLGVLLISAVRYALGRSTYIVGETCALVRLYGGCIPEREMAVIILDITKAIQRGQQGMDIDHAEWESLLEDITALESFG